MRTLADDDIWWHLRDAAQLAHTHHFIRADSWTFTVAGQPWVNPEWLSELPFYLAYTWWGERGLYLHQIGDVGNDRLAQGRQLLLDALARLFVAIKHTHARALFEKSRGGGSSDSARPASNQNPLVFQTFHALSPLLFPTLATFVIPSEARNLGFASVRQCIEIRDFPKRDNAKIFPFPNRDSARIFPTGKGATSSRTDYAG